MENTQTPAGDPFAGLDQTACTIDQAAPADGAAGPAPAPGINTAEVLEQVISPACAVFAPAWGVTDEEVKQLAGVYAALVDKYFPGGVGEIGPELGAALVTLAVFGPRWSMPRKVTAKPSADDADPAPADGADPVPAGVPNPAMT